MASSSDRKLQLVYYHLHSSYSNKYARGDCATNYSEYISKAAGYGCPAMGFSEHGNIFGWLHKKQKIEESGMKFIHAVEIYVTESIQTKIRDNYHCVLIAKNWDGVRELNALVSKSSNTNEANRIYYVPRITLDELFATSKNIMITTACLGGVLNSDNESAKGRMIEFLAREKDRCYLEIQHHNYDEQIKYNRYLYELSQQINVPLIAGTDTHSLDEEHAEARIIFRTGLNKTRGTANPSDTSIGGYKDEQYLNLKMMSPAELVEAYQEQNSIPLAAVIQAINETVRMSEKIEPFELNRDHKYPVLYPNAEDVFKRRINEGVIDRGIQNKPNKKEYYDRIKYEYEVYKHNDAINFLLLEDDYKSYARKNGIPYGPGRGSVTGSLIAYILRLTDIDSIQYNLNFERFMNPERVSLADIDTDWYKSDRPIVKDYLFHRDGLFCCDVPVFITYGMPDAIRCVGRAKGISASESNKIVSKYKEDPAKCEKDYPYYVKWAKILNGLITSQGTHASACVVSPYSVDEWMGTAYSEKTNSRVSCLDMKEVDYLNFVKLDFLGLLNMGLISETCKLAGIPVCSSESIVPDDDNVWESIRTDSRFIFQFESKSASKYLNKILAPDTVAKFKAVNPNITRLDIFAMASGALRPAAQSFRDSLANGEARDNGHPALNEMLSSTMGYLLYQEQIIEFLHKFCGYTMGEADVVRRGFSKKIGTEKFIPKIESGFIKTMKEQYNVDEPEATKLIVNFIQVIKDASEYLFSKNHAIPYSILGYYCGYLRYYYPQMFITVALNVFRDDVNAQNKISELISYAKDKKIALAFPRLGDKVSGQSLYDKEQDVILQPMGSIKGMNDRIPESINDLTCKLGRKKLLSLAPYDLFVKLYEMPGSEVKKLNILMKIGFFSNYMEINKMIKLYDIFAVLYKKQRTSKSVISSIGLSENVVRPYAMSESETGFSNVNVELLINSLSKTITVKPKTLNEVVSDQLQYIGESVIANPKYAGLFVVSDVNTKYSPKLKITSLKTGASINVKVQKHVFNKNGLEAGDIIKLTKQCVVTQAKTEYVDGEYVPIEGEYENWLTSYTKPEVEYIG